MPGVLNTRVDVGGANATTMQAYRAYGLDGGRGEIEGINSSQFGSGGLLSYSDMEAFDDMAINTTGNSAETPVPGHLRQRRIQGRRQHLPRLGIIKDKLWWFGAARLTQLNRRYPVLIDDIAITTIPAYTGKLTYNLNQNHKVTAFYTTGGRR